MTINKRTRRILKAFSFDRVDLKSARHLTDLKAIDPLKIFRRKVDYQVFNGDYPVPVRIYLPAEPGKDDRTLPPVLLFFHGGGWVTEHVDNYDRVCARMAKATGCLVVAVEYRLAPEHKFPTGLLDCYAVAEALYRDKLIPGVRKDQITLIGDSAGGNLAAAVSLMARDEGEFLPRRQILIYPATNSDYSENSIFPSVRENGNGYILTAGRMRDYIQYYARNEEDKKNPYFAPVLEKDLSGQPDTLIITAEFDPLRDEGEVYGHRLEKAGNKVEIHRIKDALHGFFSLGIKFYPVQESFSIITEFLKET